MTKLRLALTTVALLALTGCGKGGSSSSSENPVANADTESASPATVDAKGYAVIEGAAPSYREFKDWILACDNTGACVAKYVTADDGAGGGGYLSIQRDAGSDGKLNVTLENVGDDPTAPDPDSLRLDGKRLAAEPWTLKAKDQTATLDGEAALQFIRGIRDGSVLAMSDGKAAPWVSLRGMKAALLAMDETQGRLDGQTAMIRAGAAPASAVPTGQAMPTVYAAVMRNPLSDPAPFAAAVRKAAAKILKRHDCQPGQASADEAHALNATEAVVILGCEQAAYQGSSLLFVAPRQAPDQARQLILPLEPRLDPKDSTTSDGEYVEAAWDDKTATLSQSAKGRGVADCGSSSSWTYDGQQFHLSQYNALPRCGGGPPGDWPTIYRGRVVVR